MSETLPSNSWASASGSGSSLFHQPSQLDPTPALSPSGQVEGWQEEFKDVKPSTAISDEANCPVLPANTYRYAPPKVAKLAKRGVKWDDAVEVQSFDKFGPEVVYGEQFSPTSNTFVDARCGKKRSPSSKSKILKSSMKASRSDGDLLHARASTTESHRSGYNPSTQASIGMGLPEEPEYINSRNLLSSYKMTRSGPKPRPATTAQYQSPYASAVLHQMKKHKAKKGGRSAPNQMLPKLIVQESRRVFKHKKTKGRANEASAGAQANDASSPSLPLTPAWTRTSTAALQVVRSRIPYDGRKPSTAGSYLSNKPSTAVSTASFMSGGIQWSVRSLWF